MIRGGPGQNRCDEILLKAAPEYRFGAFSEIPSEFVPKTEQASSPGQAHPEPHFGAFTV
jgi:hypothetical protein